MSAENKEYIEIRKFGIVLRRLVPEYLEAIRVWRNDPKVSQWLVFQGQIEPEQQRKWFDSLDETLNFYYVIEYQGQLIGLVNLKNYDAAAGSAEGGIFIGEEECQNGLLAVGALLAIYDFGFQALRLKEITAYVKINNSRALRLNQALGFRKVQNQPSRADDTELWILQSDHYYERTARMREYISAQKI